MSNTVDANRVGEFLDDPEDLDEKVRLLASLVRASQYTVFLTGAGISTSVGISDYRGPSGCWTMRRMQELRAKNGDLTRDEDVELQLLEAEQRQEVSKVDTSVAAEKKLPKEFMQPGVSHMAIATMIHLGLAHYCVTTNLDGLLRKAGLVPHEELCCLHGDAFTERCTCCGYEFERNYKVRVPGRHVHDHHVGTCDHCGSCVPSEWTGMPKGSVEQFQTVSMKSQPAHKAVSLARIHANIRQKWPNAVLKSLNEQCVEGMSDTELRMVVEKAELPLHFKFSTGRIGGVKTGGDASFVETHLVGVMDRNVGTKDTHINFGEQLDDKDWDEADKHCKRAQLCIVLGTSLSLRHTAHFPFMAQQTVIVNLQATPDDHRCFRGLRIWGTCDDVLQRLLTHLAVPGTDPIPAWRPRDALSLESIVSRSLPAKCVALARHIDLKAHVYSGTASSVEACTTTSHMDTSLMDTSGGISLDKVTDSTNTDKAAASAASTNATDVFDSS